MFCFINVIRTLATCLITNSHFSPIYTYDIIAKGGALGNSLFFLATGFCLANCSENFKTWYSKRLLRLYIPLLFASSFYLFTGNNLLETLFFSFIFPQNYWFICALIILYPLFYFAVKYPFRNRKYVYSIFLILLYGIIYSFLDKSHYMVETVEFYAIRFSYIFSFFLMLLGAYFKLHFQKITEALSCKKILLSILFLISLIFYFGFILMMGHWKVLYNIQFIETILCIFTSTFLFLRIMLAEKEILMQKDSLLYRIFSILGTHTLEIYLVQFPLIDLIGSLNLSSSLKFFLAVTSIIVCASILKFISNCITQKKTCCTK